MQITRSSIDTAKGPGDWFTGDVYIDSVAAAPPPFRVTATLVHFMPGARTHWHRHPLSQTVFVTEGNGLCQRRDGRIEAIRPGDRVLFEADEEHWHGAAPSRLMVHLAINEGDDQHDVVHWLEPVTNGGIRRSAAGPPLTSPHNSRVAPHPTAGDAARAPRATGSAAIRALTHARHTAASRRGAFAQALSAR